MEIAENDVDEYQEWLKEFEVNSNPHPEHFKYNSSFYRHKEGWIIGELIAKPLFEIRNKTFDPNDIIVTSMPKSGSVWLAQTVYLIETLDFKGASEKTIADRIHFLERPNNIPNKSGQTPTGTRLKATHLPLSLLPKDILEKKCKIIHIARNPKDRLVSFYHYMQMLEIISYKGTFKDIFHAFVKDELGYLPYAKYILEYWKRRNDENVLYLTYESMQKDIIGNIKNISEFIGKPRTEEQVQQIAEQCSFNQMAANPATNYNHWDRMGLKSDNKMKFLRKGKVGDWKNYFDEELEKEFQDWYDTNFKDEDIQFEYEI